jgi:SAM-dependent methyltransferase
MASDKRWVLSRVPNGPGRALDLGGGRGELYVPLKARGYEYVNLDVAPSGPGAVVGDAHDLPFDAESFDLIVSSDSLEHFHTPLVVLRGVARVLKPHGRFVVWVPFMHPFHGDDYYRYSRLGLEHLLREAGLQMVSIEAPLGPFTICGQMLVVAARRIGLGSLERPIERLAAWVDGRIRSWSGGNAYAAFYLVVAAKQRPEAAVGEVAPSS